MSDPFADDARGRRPKRFSDPLGDGDSLRGDIFDDSNAASQRDAGFSWRRLPSAVKIAVGGTGAMLAVALALLAGSAVLGSFRTDNGNQAVSAQTAPGSVAADSRQRAAEDDSAGPSAGSPITTLPGQAASPTDGDTDGAETAGGADWRDVALSIVYVQATDCEGSGSGSVVIDGSYALTNSHVVHSGSRLCADIGVAFIDEVDSPPQGRLYPATVVADDPRLDLAVLKLSRAAPKREPLRVERRDLALGDEIVTLGFPGAGGGSITLTWGRLAGTYDDGAGSPYYKTDAMMNPGVSGGAAFDAMGRFVGVTTAGSSDEGGSLGLIRPASDVVEFLNRVAR